MRKKKRKERFVCSLLLVFVRTRGERETQVSSFLIKERERETHARAHHHSRFSIIIVSDLYQRDREKEWLRERFE